MIPTQRLKAIQAARSPPPGGRHERGRATRNPCKIRLSAALALPPAEIGLAGDTGSPVYKGFSRPGRTPVLQTASRLGGSAVGRTDCVNNYKTLCRSPQVAILAGSIRCGSPAVRAVKPINKEN